MKLKTIAHCSTIAIGMSCRRLATKIEWARMKSIMKMEVRSKDEDESEQILIWQYGADLLGVKVHAGV